CSLVETLHAVPLDQLIPRLSLIKQRRGLQWGLLPSSHTISARFLSSTFALFNVFGRAARSENLPAVLCGSKRDVCSVFCPCGGDLVPSLNWPEPAPRARFPSVQRTVLKRLRDDRGLQKSIPATTNGARR